MANQRSSRSTRLKNIWEKLCNGQHDGRIHLEQVSRESRLRGDRQFKEVEQQLLMTQRNLENKLAEVTANNERSEKENQELDLQIQQRGRSRAYQDKQKQVTDGTNKIAALQRKNERRSRSAASILACFTKLGLSFGTREDDSSVDETCLRMHGIHPSEDQTFFLWFSQLGGEDNFIVVRADPRFDEFEALAIETNHSQDLVKLLMESRRCWIKKYGRLP